MNDDVRTVYVSTLTLYLYENEERINLNIEEADKFFEGIKHHSNTDRYMIFLDFDWNKVEALLENLTPEEIRAYRDKVIAQLTTRGKLVNYYTVDLTSYESTYSVVSQKLSELIGSSRNRYVIYVNVSCGHKPGAIATYIATLNVGYKKCDECRRRKVIVKPFHVERGKITNLPSVNIPGAPGSREEDIYLQAFRYPVSYEESEKIAREMGFDGDWGALASRYKKMGYIVNENGKLALTKRGKTLVALLSSL